MTEGFFVFDDDRLPAYVIFHSPCIAILGLFLYSIYPVFYHRYRLLWPWMRQVRRSMVSVGSGLFFCAADQVSFRPSVA